MEITVNVSSNVVAALRTLAALPAGSIVLSPEDYQVFLHILALQRQVVPNPPNSADNHNNTTVTNVDDIILSRAAQRVLSGGS